MTMIEMYRALGIFGKDLNECRDLAETKVHVLIGQRDAYYAAAEKKKNMINEVRKQLSSAKDADAKIELLISIDEMTAEYMQLLYEAQRLESNCHNLRLAKHGDLITELMFDNAVIELEDEEK